MRKSELLNVGMLSAALLAGVGMADAAELTGRKRKSWWESLTDEQRAEIAARRKAEVEYAEKHAEEFRARRQAEHEAYVAKSQSKSAKKRSGMTGKAFRRWQKLGRRMARLHRVHDAQEIERLDRLRNGLESAPSRKVARMRRVR